MAAPPADVVILIIFEILAVAAIFAATQNVQDRFTNSFEQPAHRPAQRLLVMGGGLTVFEHFLLL